MPKQKYERKISNCKHGDEEPKAKTEDHFKPLVIDTEWKITIEISNMKLCILPVHVKGH